MLTLYRLASTNFRHLPFVLFGYEELQFFLLSVHQFTLETQHRCSASLQHIELIICEMVYVWLGIVGKVIIYAVATHSVMNQVITHFATGSNLWTYGLCIRQLKTIFLLCMATDSIAFVKLS